LPESIIPKKDQHVISPLDVLSTYADQTRPLGEKPHFVMPHAYKKIMGIGSVLVLNR
jgi:hypothetical protein